MKNLPKSNDNIPMPSVKPPKASCLILGVEKNEEQKKSLEQLGEFLGLKIISYQDRGKSEIYTFIRIDDKRADLKINTNQVKFNSSYLHSVVYK